MAVAPSRVPRPGMLDLLVRWEGGGGRSTIAARSLRADRGWTVGEAPGCDVAVPTPSGPGGARVRVRIAGGRVSIELGAVVVRAQVRAAPSALRRSLRARWDTAMLRPLAAALVAHALVLGCLALRGGPSALHGIEEEQERTADRARLLAAIDRRPPVARLAADLDAYVDRHAPPASSARHDVAAPDVAPPLETAAAHPPPQPVGPRSVVHAGSAPAHIGTQVAIHRDAPDLLDMIHAQIDSWDPHLVTGSYTPGFPLTDAANFPSRRVPASVIASVVGANMGRFRVCHAAGLPSSTGVGGEVDVAFVVEPTGAVGEARDAGGGFPDDAVRRCVVRTFQALIFPPPPLGQPQPATFAITLAAEDVAVPRDPRQM
jgi:hypothetical protein